MTGNPLLNMMGGNNPMMNNPLMKIISMARNGSGNPMQMLQQFAGQNPQMQQIMNMVNGKDQNQMNEMIANTAKEKGVDLKQLANQIGMPPEIAKKYGINMD